MALNLGVSYSTDHAYSLYTDRAVYASRTRGPGGQLSFYWIYTQHYRNILNTSGETKEQIDRGSKLAEVTWSLYDDGHSMSKSRRVWYQYLVLENTFHYFF